MKAWKGHKEGAEVLEEFLEWAKEKDEISAISIYALSHDNKENRPQREVKKLMEIYEEKFNKLLESDKIENTKVNFIGQWKNLNNPTLKDTIKKLIDETEKYTKNTLNILFNYFTNKVPKYQSRQEEKVSNIDLLIRTGGEKRISGFLPKKVAYSELVFLQKYFPACDISDWERAFDKFKERNRRFGE